MAVDVVGIDDLLRRIEAAVIQLKGSIDERIASRITEIGDTIEGTKESLLSSIEEGIDSVRDAVSTVPNRINNAINSLSNQVNDLVNQIKDKVGDALDNVMHAVITAANVVAANLQAAIVGLEDVISEAIKSIVQGISDLGERVITTLGSVINTIKESVRDGVNQVSGVMNRLVDRVRSTIEEGLHFVGTNVSKVVGTVSDAINKGVKHVREIIEVISDNIQRIYEDVIDYTTKTLLPGIRNEIEGLDREINHLADVFTKATLGGYTSFDDLMGDIFGGSRSDGVFPMIVGFVFFSMAIAPAIGSVVAPAVSNISHLAYEKFRPTLIETGTAIEAYHRGEITEVELRSNLAKLGLSDRFIEVLMRTSRPLLSPNDVAALYMRGYISEAEHDAYLKKYGYTQQDIESMKSLYWDIPGPSDLIRMAVREAFNPEQVERGGLLEDFPDEFAYWVEKQGISLDWAKRYWAAHWQLPSLRDAFEMFHRGVITEDELNALMRAQDIAPGYRKDLIAIAYHPLDRVDVRRMYNLGVLDRDGVKRAYLDLGYDEEKAEWLTEFTVRLYDIDPESGEDNAKTLSRAIITKAYKRGLINKETAQARLEALGYTPADADLLLELEDANTTVNDEDPIMRDVSRETRKYVLKAYRVGGVDYLEAKGMLVSTGLSDVEAESLLDLVDTELAFEARDNLVELVQSLYVQRTIDDATMLSLLQRLNMRSEEINRLKQRWDLQRELRDRKPTKTDILRWLRKGYITKDVAAEELKGLGYPDKYVSLYLRDVGA